MKVQEGSELAQMNREYADLDFRKKKQERKNARVEELNDILIDKWRQRRLLQKSIQIWKVDGGDYGR